MSRHAIEDPLLSGYRQTTRICLAACFIFAILSGDSIRSIPVKTSTAEGYIRDFCKQFRKAKLVNPFFDPGEDGRSPLIQNLLDIQARWEQLPKRRDPFTKRMLRQLQQECRDERAPFTSATPKISAALAAFTEPP